ncbi:unnamed protein product [Symbiodinium sp. CCMP2592]|nr:unnamed protein product [Symbiodinium sp. CCMP2592]
MRSFSWVFALCAAAIHNVAAHRISTHSIDTSGSSVMKEENEESPRRIEELMEFGAQDEPENSTDQEGRSQATSAVITALDQYVAHQKSRSESRIDRQRAESIELLKQPAAEQIVSATNAYFEQQASIIEQLRQENEQLRKPGYFEWNISGEDYSGLAKDESVESPHFSLGLGSEFWLRYYPKGTAAAGNGQASLYLIRNVKAAAWGTISVDSVSKDFSPGSDQNKFAYSWGFPDVGASGKHHILSVNITKVEFEAPLNFTQ